MEINFKSLSPTYERRPVISSVEELFALGCSSDLVSNILIGDGYNPLIPPEEWFWADRERLGADGPWIDELYHIAGGGFVNLPLAEQAKLLNLPVREIKLEKSMKARGRWVLNDGRVGTIEEAALDAILLPDELGFNDKGEFVQIIHSMIVQIAKIAFEKAFDLEQASRVKPRTQEHLNQMREALNFFFRKSDYFVEKLWPRFDRSLGKRISKAEFRQYIDKLGNDFLSRFMLHSIEKQLSGAGHPDLTIIGSSIRFAEVKGQDRLGGLKPLGSGM